MIVMKAVKIGFPKRSMMQIVLGCHRKERAISSDAKHTSA